MRGEKYIYFLSPEIHLPQGRYGGRWLLAPTHLNLREGLEGGSLSGNFGSSWLWGGGEGLAPPPLAGGLLALILGGAPPLPLERFEIHLWGSPPPPLTPPGVPPGSNLVTNLAPKFKLETMDTVSIYASRLILE